MTKILGIDPGKSGAFCLIESHTLSIVNYWPMPIVGKDYDIPAMAKILIDLPLEVRVIVERITANNKGGKASNFDLGRGVGILEALLIASQLTVQYMQPKEWQKKVWTGVRLADNPKETSYNAAIRFNPDGQTFKNIGAKGQPLTTLNEGLIDAYLIAVAFTIN